MLLIRFGIFCFAFGARVHKRIPIFPLQPEESRLSIWEMQAWPYSVVFLSWKMNTEKSTKSYNISSQTEQASSIILVKANLWWETHTFLPRQLEAVWRAVFSTLCSVCALGLTGTPTPAPLRGRSPNLVMLQTPWFRLAGSVGRLGTTWVPKLELSVLPLK